MGTTTLSVMTLSVMTVSGTTFGFMGLYVKIIINDTQHYNNL
jgi:hypothetical protein